MNKLFHVNPNCKNAEICKPHGEHGEVFYYTKTEIEEFIEQAKRDIEDKKEYIKLLTNYLINDN